MSGAIIDWLLPENCHTIIPTLVNMVLCMHLSWSTALQVLLFVSSVAAYKRAHQILTDLDMMVENPETERYEGAHAIFNVRMNVLRDMLKRMYEKNDYYTRMARPRYAGNFYHCDFWLLAPVCADGRAKIWLF